MRLSRTSLRGVAGWLAIALGGTVCLALVRISPSGDWPDDWPKKLESCRPRAKTVDVAHGIQERIYEIPFQNQAEFERLWPVFLELKSKGGPLTLHSVGRAGGPSSYGLFDNTLPAVRVLAPAHGARVGERANALHAGPPWPDSIKSEQGELPEYVVPQGRTWVAHRDKEPTGFLFRARVDLELVVDGKIIDLNRIRLPVDTPIVDKRTLEQEQSGPATQPTNR